MARVQAPLTGALDATFMRRVLGLAAQAAAIAGLLFLVGTAVGVWLDYFEAEAIVAAELGRSY